MEINKKKYIIIFAITSGLFASVFLLVNFLDSTKRESISDLQRTITVDLIANETQFDLLKNAPCKAIEGESVLSRQMSELGRKLVYAEKTQGVDNKEVLELKKYYSLLEVKDYLLSQEVAQKCDIQIESIIYFYENNCEDCDKQGYVLTELKRLYPWLRIYSFDRGLDFSIVKTFANLYDLSEKAPIIIIDGEKYAGFKTVEEIEGYIPALALKKEQEELIEQGIDFINQIPIYRDRSSIVFKEQVNSNIYIYIISFRDADHVIQKGELSLKYSDEGNEFIIASYFDKDDRGGEEKNTL